MKKILVAEDEAAIREFVVINLQRAGYKVIQAECGETALKKYNEEGSNFDVAILDIMMPGMDGFTLCKELRKKSDTIGIILLTAKTQEMDKVNGLMIGADDYVTKPFSPSELVARVDALCRRVELSKQRNLTKVTEKLHSGDFSLNLRNRNLQKGSIAIEITQVEFQILEYFFSNPGVVLSRTDILHHVWGSQYAGEEKRVDVNIRRLRMKIEDQPSAPVHIITVWGMGYKWEA